MRAGPLSNPGIVARLNAEFVNAWILLRDLKALAQTEGEAGAFAKIVLERFEYPVDDLVFTSRGEYVGHVPANSEGAYSASRFAAMLDAAVRAEAGRRA